jgi:hypothetical protein
MSKKQLTKKKINLKLLPGESAVVLTYDQLMHIAETYDYLGGSNQDEYSQSFYDLADEIRKQSLENYFDSNSDEYDDEW